MDKVRWRELKPIQPENFKELSKQSYDKLRQSLIKNNFIAPFAVWQNKEEIYTIDGVHRQKVLLMLEADGVEVPETLDAVFIDCKSRKEAAKLLLVYSSAYARTTDEGLYEFLNQEMLNFDELKLEIDMPDIDLGRFEKGYLKEEQPPDFKSYDENIETEHRCPECGYEWSGNAKT